MSAILVPMMMLFVFILIFYLCEFIDYITTRICKKCRSKNVKWVLVHWWKHKKCMDCNHVMISTHSTGL